MERKNPNIDKGTGLSGKRVKITRATAAPSLFRVFEYVSFSFWHLLTKIQKACGVQGNSSAGHPSASLANLQNALTAPTVGEMTTKYWERA